MPPGRLNDMTDMTDSEVAVPIRLQSLRKEFGSTVAVDGIDLTVQAGSVFGFLGPNGAGKTTTLRMMLGLIRPTSGSAELFGRDPAQVGVAALEGVAGFVEAPMFYPYLSARRNLHLLADLDGGLGHDRVEQVLGVVELTGRGNDKVGGYSQGMKQRLGLAGALLREPKLLLLDEPTNGLDPGGMRDMRALIGDLAAEGLTVLLSSHLMGEVEQLCTDLAVVAHGRIRFSGTLEELREGHGDHDYRLGVTDPSRAMAAAADLTGVSAEVSSDGDLLVRADRAAAEELTIALGRAGVGIHAMVPDTTSLERLFFELTETEPGPTARGLDAGVPREGLCVGDPQTDRAEADLHRSGCRSPDPGDLRHRLRAEPGVRGHHRPPRRCGRRAGRGLQQLRAAAALHRRSPSPPWCCSRCWPPSSRATSWQPRTTARPSRPC